MLLLLLLVMVVVMVLYVWPGIYTRMKPTAVEARFWANVCTQFAKGSKFARASGLYEWMVIDSVSAAGELVARLRLAAPLENTMQSLHGGAAALIVDELTTVSIMSQRCFPGVTLSLSLQYLAGCKRGDVVVVTSRVLRAGLKVVHTEAEFRLEDGTLLVRASHVKYCAAPRPWFALLWIRTSVAQLFMPWALKQMVPKTPAALTTLPSASSHAAAADPFSEKQKKDYFASLGEGVEPAQQLVGFDLVLAGARLVRTGPRTMVLEAPKEVGNPNGALHGGATAMLVDIIGTSAIAREVEANGESCGVATNLDVQYGAAGKGKIEFEITVLRLGARVATVKVIARDSRQRLVCQGTVTKYGKFKSI